MAARMDTRRIQRRLCQEIPIDYHTMDKMEHQDSNAREMTLMLLALTYLLQIKINKNK
jgi:hypothetical protein